MTFLVDCLRLPCFFILEILFILLDDIPGREINFFPKKVQLPDIPFTLQISSRKPAKMLPQQKKKTALLITSLLILNNLTIVNTQGNIRSLGDLIRTGVQNLNGNRRQIGQVFDDGIDNGDSNGLQSAAIPIAAAVALAVGIGVGVFVVAVIGSWIWFANNPPPAGPAGPAGPAAPITTTTCVPGATGAGYFATGANLDNILGVSNLAQCSQLCQSLLGVQCGGAAISGTPGTCYLYFGPVTTVITASAGYTYQALTCSATTTPSG